MKLIRYETPTDVLLGDLDRLFGTVTPDRLRLGHVFGTLLGDAPWTGSPAADLFEDADHYFVKIELPGVKKDDLRVELQNDTLTVAASRPADNEGAPALEFSRALTVPEGIASDKITAAYENGVLTVTLPKPAARKPRTIAVN